MGLNYTHSAAKIIYTPSAFQTAPATSDAGQELSAASGDALVQELSGAEEAMAPEEEEISAPAENTEETDAEYDSADAAVDTEEIDSVDEDAADTETSDAASDGGDKERRENSSRRRTLTSLMRKRAQQDRVGALSFPFNPLMPRKTQVSPFTEFSILF